MNNKFLIFSFGIFGFVALTFQVVFAKNLVLLFGLTAPAVATVLAVYFSGLALGSLLFGQVVDRLSLTAIRRIYGALFFLLGVYGLFFPLIFKLLNFLILMVNNTYPLQFAGFNFFAFFFSFLLLLLPTTVIGGGFPIINKLLVHKTDEIGKKVSRIYFIETLGNVFGVLAAGFWFIPAFGNNTTIFLAAGLSIIVSVFLFFFFKTNSIKKEVHEIYVIGENTEDIQSPTFLYVLFVTGFLALALEVLYTKTLILFIGSSTYAFSIILVTFLLGIAIGSWVASLFIDQIERGVAYLGLFLSLIGFWLFLTLKFFENVPFWYLNIFKSYESLDFSAILSSQVLVTFSVIFPATLLMGITFPLCIKLAKADFHKLGQGVGKLYFANTLGGVLGSLVAGFILLPILGYSRTLVLILVSYLSLGGYFFVQEKKLGRAIKSAIIFFLIVWTLFSIFSSPWAKRNLTLGSFIYAPSYISFGEKVVRETILDDKFLFYKEGLSNIAVIQRGANLLLKINGKVDASDTVEDLESEILAGVLPMMFHPDPEEVLVVGLGSGITLGSINQFDAVKKIDVVEIDPTIVKAADFFKKDTHDAINDPRVKIILADGRNYMSLNDKKYDVISSHPSNIWVSGNAYLFTKEYYELAKSHLKKDGLMLQWIQAYSLSTEDIRTVLKTFQATFPHAYLFNSANSGDLFLVGSLEENKSILDIKELQKKFSDKKISDELARVYIMNPFEFLAYLVSEGDRLRKFSDSSIFNTDDKNVLEFSAPKSIYQGTTIQVLKDINLLRSVVDLSVFNIPESKTKDLDTLKKQFEFRRNLLPTAAALSSGDLFGALDMYEKATESGLKQMSIEANLLRRCNIAALMAQQSGGDKDEQIVWKKCEEAFRPIEAGSAQ